MPKARSGNITGQTFDIGVQNQINIRQKKLGKLNRNDQDLIYYNASTSWLRLGSSINLSELALSDPNNTNSTLEKLPFLPLGYQYAGNQLAKQCVLFGGTVGINDIYGQNNELNFQPQFNQGIITPDQLKSNPLQGAYGWGGILSGYRPMPAIVSADVSFYNRGALAKATIKIKANSIEQLQILDVLYFRVGYTMLLEWGHTIYYDNNGNLQNFTDFNTKPFLEFFKDDNTATQNTIIESIRNERAERSYNYDALFGKVTNFSWTYTDQGYDIELKLVGLGDIVESLKINKGTGLTTDPDAVVNTANNTLENLRQRQQALESDLANFLAQNGKLQVDELLQWGATTGNSTIALSTSAPTGQDITQEQINQFSAAVNELLDQTSNASLYSVASTLGFGELAPGVTPRSLTDLRTIAQSSNDPAIQEKAQSLLDSRESDLQLVYDIAISLGGVGGSSSKDYKSVISTIITELRTFIGTYKTKAQAVVGIRSQIAAAESRLEQAKVTATNAILGDYNRSSFTRFLYEKIYRNSSNIAEIEKALTPYTDLSGIKIPKPYLQLGLKKTGDTGDSYAFTQHYIKLSVVFSYIQKELLIYDSSKPSSPDNVTFAGTDRTPDPNAPTSGVPFINIDLDDNNTFCMSFPNQMSGDPNVCVIPFLYYNQEDLKNVDGDLAAIPPIPKPTPTPYFIGLQPEEAYSPNGYLVKDNLYLGKPLNIYVNINFISTCVVDNTDRAGKTNLISFLSSLLTGINEALGGINRMEINYNAETNSIRIVEENPLKYGLARYNDPLVSVFNVNGIQEAPKSIFDPPSKTFTTNDYLTSENLWGSFITKVNFTVNIPPNMAAMATIAAQSSGNIVGENATAISKMNKGLEDRIITTKLDPDTLSAKSGSASDPEVILKNNLKVQKSLIDTIYQKYLLAESSTEGLTDINKDISAYVVGYESLKEKMPAPFFLPFNLSLEMHGLSGMVNYERFSITENILPETYRTTEVRGQNGAVYRKGIIDFLIKGVSHEISTNAWMTKIESLTVNSERYEEIQVNTSVAQSSLPSTP